MDEKPRIVAYKLIIDANIVKHKGRKERQNIVHAMEANNGNDPYITQRCIHLVEPGAILACRSPQQ
jgi:IMP cyclohydrolase